MPASISCIPRIDVTSEEQAEYDGRMARLLQRAAAEYSGFHGHLDFNDWALVRKKQQMSIFRSAHGAENPRVTLFAGSGLLAGILEDVMDGLYADNTTDFCTIKSFLTKKFVDGVVLNASEKRIPEAPYRFAGIKWAAVKAAWGLVKRRDILTYERMGIDLGRQRHRARVSHHAVNTTP